MNDLIINGIDHSMFDLEWAEHGGVLSVIDSKSPQITLLKFVRELTPEKIDVSILLAPDGTPVTNFYEHKKHFRMATPSECAEAGIEYIEPLARWLPIESAPKDGTKVVLLTPTGDMLSPCEFVEGTAISETGAWLWWQVGPEWFTEVKNPTHYMTLPILPKENK